MLKLSRPKMLLQATSSFSGLKSASLLKPWGMRGLAAPSLASFHQFSAFRSQMRKPVASLVQLPKRNIRLHEY